MNAKSALEILARAEKAGLRVIVDPDADAAAGRESPIDPAISPIRCDLVAEARRIAQIVADRPATPPPGCVYRHDAEALQAALSRAARRLDSILKENGNGKQTRHPAPDDQQPADAGDVRDDAGADGDRGRGAAARPGGAEKGKGKAG